MATYRLTGPDGSTYNVTAPDNASQDDVFKMFHANTPAASPTAPVAKTPDMGDLPLLGGVSPNAAKAALGAAGKGFGDVALGAQNLIGKGISAVGGIGQQPTLSSLIAPQQNIVQRAGSWLQNDAQAGKANLAAQVAPLKAANPMAATVGELAGNGIATLPVGGMLAAPVRGIATAVPAIAGVANPLANALATSGFSAGGATGAAGLAARTIGGGITGATQVGLVSPENAGTGAVIGAALPGALKVAGAAGGLVAEGAQSAAKKLMQSALKPTAAQLKNGDAATAVQTLLDYNINPTAAGVNKLKGIIGDFNDQIKDAISSSTAKIDKSKVSNALADTRHRFTNQVDPSGDLQVIDKVQLGFQNHPSAPGADLPVQLAQDLKQGTYKVLKGKFGEAGSAQTEAQKSLARGLKEQIAEAVPAVAPLNAEESRLLATLTVAERRALADANKNPMGLAALAQSPVSWAMFMADRSTAFKSLAARALNKASSFEPPPVNALTGPALYRSLPRTQARQNP